MYEQLRAYSADLRSRVAAARGQPDAPRAQVAQHFGVSVSFITKLLRRQRTSGSLAPKPATGGRPRGLDAPVRARLVAQVRAQPDATLAELRAWLRPETGHTVGVVWRALAGHDLRRTKEPFTPPGATRPAS